jgi:hypothetical protein
VQRDDDDWSAGTIDVYDRAMASLKRSSVHIAMILALLVVAAPATALTPKQQIASLRKQLAAARHTNKALAARNARVNGLYLAQQTLYKLAQATIQAQAAGGAAAIIAGGPDAIWAAVNAFWPVFPTFGLDSHCGYTRSGATTTAPGPVTTDVDFERITNCSG